MFRWVFSTLGLSLAILLVTAVSCRTQAPTPPPSTDNSAPSAGSTAATPTASPKKVWTNDDLGSGSGARRASEKSKQKYVMTKPVDDATVARVRQNLQKLEGQLDDVNKQLLSYKQFEEGEAVSSGARQINKGYTRTPVDQQMATLQEKKKKLQTEIDDLLDDARKKGIESGQLR